MRSNPDFVLTKTKFVRTKTEIDDLWADQVSLKKEMEQPLLQKYLELFRARLAINHDQRMEDLMAAAEKSPEDVTRLVLHCAILECELTLEDLEDIEKSKSEQGDLTSEMVINIDMRRIEIDKFKKIKELLSNPENVIDRLDVVEKSKKIELKRAILASGDASVKEKLANVVRAGEWLPELNDAINSTLDGRIKIAAKEWYEASTALQMIAAQEAVLSPLRAVRDEMKRKIRANESKAKQELIKLTNQFINPTKTHPSLTNKDEEIAIPRAIAELKKKEKDKALSLEDSENLRNLRAAIEKAIRCEIEASADYLGEASLDVSSKAETYAANLGEKKGYFLNFTKSPHFLKFISSSIEMPMHSSSSHYSVSLYDVWERRMRDILKEEQDSALIRKCEINLEEFRSNLGQRIAELGGNKEAEEKALMELKLRKSFVEELSVRARILRYGWLMDLDRESMDLELRRITATQKYLTHYLKSQNVEVVTAGEHFGKERDLAEGVPENINPEVLRLLKRQMKIAELEERKLRPLRKSEYGSVINSPTSSELLASDSGRKFTEAKNRAQGILSSEDIEPNFVLDDVTFAKLKNLSKSSDVGNKEEIIAAIKFEIESRLLSNKGILDESTVKQVKYCEFSLGLKIGSLLKAARSEEYSEVVMAITKERLDGIGITESQSHPLKTLLQEISEISSAGNEDDSDEKLQQLLLEQRQARKQDLISKCDYLRAFSDQALLNSKRVQDSLRLRPKNLTLSRIDAAIRLRVGQLDPVKEGSEELRNLEVKLTHAQLLEQQSNEQQLKDVKIIEEEFAKEAVKDLREQVEQITEQNTRLLLESEAALHIIRAKERLSKDNFRERAELEIKLLRDKEGDESVIQHRANDSKPLKKRAEILEARKEARLINDTSSKEWQLAQNKIASLENELNILALEGWEVTTRKKIEEGDEQAQERLKLLQLEGEELGIKSNLLRIQKQLLAVDDSNKQQKEPLQMVEYFQKAKLQKFQKLQKVEVVTMGLKDLNDLNGLALPNLGDEEETIKNLRKRNNELDKKFTSAKVEAERALILKKIARFNAKDEYYLASAQVELLTKVIEQRVAKSVMRAAIKWQKAIEETRGQNLESNEEISEGLKLPVTEKTKTETATDARLELEAEILASGNEELQRALKKFKQASKFELSEKERKLEIIERELKENEGKLKKLRERIDEVVELWDLIDPKKESANIGAEDKRLKELSKKFESLLKKGALEEADGLPKAFFNHVEILELENGELEQKSLLLQAQKRFIQSDDPQDKMQEYQHNLRLKILVARQQSRLLRMEEDDLRQKPQLLSNSIYDKNLRLIELSNSAPTAKSSLLQSQIRQLKSELEDGSLERRKTEVGIDFGLVNYQTELNGKQDILFGKILESGDEKLMRSTIAWQEAIEKTRSQNLESGKEIVYDEKTEGKPKTVTAARLQWEQDLSVANYPSINEAKKALDLAELQMGVLKLGIKKQEFVDEIALRREKFVNAQQRQDTLSSHSILREVNLNDAAAELALAKKNVLEELLGLQSSAWVDAVTIKGGLIVDNKSLRGQIDALEKKGIDDEFLNQLKTLELEALKLNKLKQWPRVCKAAKEAEDELELSLIRYEDNELLFKAELKILDCKVALINSDDPLQKDHLEKEVKKAEIEKEILLAKKEFTEAILAVDLAELDSAPSAYELASRNVALARKNAAQVALEVVELEQKALLSPEGPDDLSQQIKSKKLHKEYLEAKLQESILEKEFLAVGRDDQFLKNENELWLENQKIVTAKKYLEYSTDLLKSGLVVDEDLADHFTEVLEESSSRIAEIEKIKKIAEANLQDARGHLDQKVGVRDLMVGGRYLLTQEQQSLSQRALEERKASRRDRENNQNRNLQSFELAPKRLTLEEEVQERDRLRDQDFTALNLSQVESSQRANKWREREIDKAQQNIIYCRIDLDRFLLSDNSDVGVDVAQLRDRAGENAEVIFGVQQSIKENLNKLPLKTRSNSSFLISIDSVLGFKSYNINGIEELMSVQMETIERLGEVVDQTEGERIGKKLELKRLEGYNEILEGLKTGAETLDRLTQNWIKERSKEYGKYKTASDLARELLLVKSFKSAEKRLGNLLKSDSIQSLEEGWNVGSEDVSSIVLDEDVSVVSQDEEDESQIQLEELKKEWLEAKSRELILQKEFDGVRYDDRNDDDRALKDTNERFLKQQKIEVAEKYCEFKIAELQLKYDNCEIGDEERGEAINLGEAKNNLEKERNIIREKERSRERSNLETRAEAEFLDAKLQEDVLVAELKVQKKIIEELRKEESTQIQAIQKLGEDDPDKTSKELALKRLQIQIQISEMESPKIEQRLENKRLDVAQKQFVSKSLELQFKLDNGKLDQDGLAQGLAILRTEREELETKSIAKLQNLKENNPTLGQEEPVNLNQVKPYGKRREDGAVNVNGLLDEMMRPAKKAEVNASDPQRYGEREAKEGVIEKYQKAKERAANKDAAPATNKQSNFKKISWKHGGHQALEVFSPEEPSANPVNTTPSVLQRKGGAYSFDAPAISASPKTLVQDPQAVKLFLIDPKNPGAAFGNDERSNKFRVAPFCYASDREIADTMAAIVRAAAREVELEIGRAIEVINIAREKGGAENIYKNGEDSKDKGFYEKDVNSNLSNRDKNFSGLFQQKCRECGIYSGRKNDDNLKKPLVGLRTAFIPEEVLELLNEKENVSLIERDEKLLEQKPKKVKNILKSRAGQVEGGVENSSR